MEGPNKQGPSIEFFKRAEEWDLVIQFDLLIWNKGSLSKIDGSMGIRSVVIMRSVKCVFIRDVCRLYFQSSYLYVVYSSLFPSDSVEVVP